MDLQEIERVRRNHIGGNLSLSYDDPLHIVRGEGQYLHDIRGDKYLDLVNNVAHLGHCHPSVVEAANQQLRVLNTNTRYYDTNLTDYVKEILTLFDPAASPALGKSGVVYLVNSGSEANELAMRIARTATKRQRIVCVDHAYHGNTEACIEVSPYKFNGKGGQGQCNRVYVAASPDPYRFEEWMKEQTEGSIQSTDTSEGDKEENSTDRGVTEERKTDSAPYVPASTIAIKKTEPNSISNRGHHFNHTSKHHSTAASRIDDIIEEYKGKSIKEMDESEVETLIDQVISACYMGIQYATNVQHQIKQACYDDIHSSTKVLPRGKTMAQSSTRNTSNQSEGTSSQYPSNLTSIYPDTIKESNHGPCAFLAESVLGCAGQVFPPEGYLSAAFLCARMYGAVCICDEVQVGLGRVGEKWWGYELQRDWFNSTQLQVATNQPNYESSLPTTSSSSPTPSTQDTTDPLSLSTLRHRLRDQLFKYNDISLIPSVTPDIVTVGKPVGNGWPLGLVITTKSLSQGFANGMEYFNTFGGSTASCAVGLSVLRALKKGGYKENARVIGEEMMKHLWQLKKEYPDVIGDVRGKGLFVGIEIIKCSKGPKGHSSSNSNSIHDDNNDTLGDGDSEGITASNDDKGRDNQDEAPLLPCCKSPCGNDASVIVNHMKERHKVLMSTDGPHHNVIKIKPPMCLNKDDVTWMITGLREALRYVREQRESEVG